MTAAWPATLPQDVFIAGYDETLPDAVLRTGMGSGPAKKRRRVTAAVRPLKAVVPLTRAQAAELDGFFVTTLGLGSLNFTWTHPRTLATVEFGFVTPPRLVPDSGDAWRASLDLEIYP